MPSPPIPEVPKDSPSGAYKLFSSIKEALEIGLGRRGNIREKFVTRGELADLGVIESATGTTPSLGLGNAAYKNVGTGAGTVAAGDHLHTGVYDPAGTGASAAASAVAAHVLSGHPWSAITDSDDAITVPDQIGLGASLTISYRRQLVVYQAMEVLGTLTIESGGKLVVL